jgi:hypothetical protein
VTSGTVAGAGRRLRAARHPRSVPLRHSLPLDGPLTRAALDACGTVCAPVELGVYREFEPKPGVATRGEGERRLPVACGREQRERPCSFHIRALEELGRDDPLWPGQLATLVALMVYLALPAALTIGPGGHCRWPRRSCWRRSSSPREGPRGQAPPGNRDRPRARRRPRQPGLPRLPIHYLLGGGRARGADLLDGGVIIWSTSLLFVRGPVLGARPGRAAPEPLRSGRPSRPISCSHR